VTVPPHSVHRHWTSKKDHAVLCLECGWLTPAEIMKIVSCSPAKHCSLDPYPTWVVKRALPLLSRRCAIHPWLQTFSQMYWSTPLSDRGWRSQNSIELSWVLTVRYRTRVSSQRPSSVSSLHVSQNTSRLSVCCRLINRPIQPTTRPRLQSQQSTMSSCATYIPASRSSYCSISVQRLIRSTTKRCWKFLVVVSVSAERMMDWFDSYLAHQTQQVIPARFTVRCHKVWFSIPRRLLLILKTWMTTTCHSLSTNSFQHTTHGTLNIFFTYLLTYLPESPSLRQQHASHRWSPNAAMQRGNT